MAAITVALRHGLKIGETVHLEAELRELTVEDLIKAGTESERVVEAGGKVHLVSSPTVAGLVMLGRQIVRIGDHQGPLAPNELMRLHTEDFLLLQHAADNMDAAATRAMEAAGERGRGDPAR